MEQQDGVVREMVGHGMAREMVRDGETAQREMVRGSGKRRREGAR